MTSPSWSRSACVRLAASFLGLFAVLAPPRTASAHGLFGHIHVTGWAIENLPEGELRTFFQDPDLVQAALMGATFPDTGYANGTAASSAYGEHAHWEPFIQDFVHRIETVYGPTYDTKEEKLLIAFMLGCASHGMQDEIFDSLFLYEVEQRDVGSSQDETDPGTDAFLVQDGHFRMLPGDYVPFSDLLPLFAGLPEAADIDQELIEHQIHVVKSIYVNDGFGLDYALAGADMYRAKMPWGSTHYLDPNVPGSLASEIEPTGKYMMALWDRIHGNFAEPGFVIHAFPSSPRRLREGDHVSVASWVTLVFGKGLQQDSASGTFVDSSMVAVPFDLSYTRWGGTSRLVRFRPGADLTPGARYTVTLESGADLIDGTETSAPHSVEFQVDCASADSATCPPIDPFVPVIDPPPAPDAGVDAGTESDAGVEGDAGALPPGRTKGGCSTSPIGAGQAPIALLALLGLVTLRRRARS